MSSTVSPITKKPNVNSTLSDNYRGIALSSCFVRFLIIQFLFKVLTNLIHLNYSLVSSVIVQHICALCLLKETLSYYTKNNSFTFCTFSDATEAFDHINYCKLFYLIIKRGLPASYIRTLIELNTGTVFVLLGPALHPIILLQ